MRLMLEQLRKDPKKIPRPNCEDMMMMLTDAMETVEIDVDARMKNLWITNALDGSEDYLVSEKLHAVVGQSVVKQRDALMKVPSPKSLKELLKKITPPKGVRRKDICIESAPVDEGTELFDCEGKTEPDIAFDADAADVEPDVTIEPSAPEAPAPETPADPETAAPTHARVDSLLESAQVFPDIAPDAKFLKEFYTLYEANGSSTTKLFKPHLMQFQSAYQSAFRSIKSRVDNAQKDTLDY